MILKLIQHGKDSALPLSEGILRQLELEPGAEVTVTVQGQRLIVEPHSATEEGQLNEPSFQDMVDRTSKRHAELFRRLAQ